MSVAGSPPEARASIQPSSRPARLARWCGGPARLGLLALIVALGLGLRLEQAVDPAKAPNFDSRAYAGIAAGLYRDHRFAQIPSSDQPVTQPSSNYSPGVPLLVGGTYFLTGGEHLGLARALLALATAAAILLAFALARRWAGPDAGLIAAVCTAIYPALLEYAGMITPEPLAATLVAAAVLAILWAPERSTLHWLLPGALLGATAMLRPEYLAMAVVLAAGVAFWVARRRDPRSGLAAAAVMLAGLVVVVAPWTIRNALTLDRFVPISTGGGQVLYAGNYLPSDGNPQRVKDELLARSPALRQRVEEIMRERGGGRTYLEEVLAQLARSRYPELEPDVALSRLGREQLADNLTERPGDYAVFLLRKVSRVWLNGPREIMERPLWQALHLLIVGAALVGLVLLFGRRPWEAALIAVLLLAATLTSALLVASPRRTLVLLPELAALAGAGTVWLLEWSRRARS